MMICVKWLDFFLRLRNFELPFFFISYYVFGYYMSIAFQLVGATRANTLLYDSKLPIFLYEFALSLFFYIKFDWLILGSAAVYVRIVVVVNIAGCFTFRFYTPIIFRIYSSLVKSTGAIPSLFFTQKSALFCFKYLTNYLLFLKHA